MLSKKILLVCFLLLTSVLTAKENTIFHQDSLNYLQENAMSIQFGISNDFNLTTFAGSSFSFKYHFSRKIALRAIGSLSTRIYNGTADLNYDESGTSDSDVMDYNNYSISGKLPIVFYPKPLNNATPYFGFGPLIGYSHVDQKQKETGSDSYRIYREAERKTNLWNIGISGLAGAELFVQKNISIHVEYFASLYYQYRKETSKTRYNDSDISEREQTSEYNEYHFDGSDVYFGLSVYF